MKSTPDDPVIFEAYWAGKMLIITNYDIATLRYNKHRIMRFILDTYKIVPVRIAFLCDIAQYQYNGELTLSLMHLLDYDSSGCRGKIQKRFCKIRLHCREIALAILCVGKLNKDYRDISAIIARCLWGARGYCKMETEVIKKKKFRVY